MSAHQPFEVLNAEGPAPYVIICDHGSNRVPAGLHDLGLPPAELQRHIAWDIGVAGICAILAERFRAPAIICGTSRLVIDCNRYPDDPTSIPEVSDGTKVPGNAGLSEADRAERVAQYFEPYHDEVHRTIERKMASGRAPAVLSIHSMTPVMRGISRPWQIALSWHDDERLSAPMLAELRKVPGITVGDNEPYALDPREDYSVPRHAMRRGLAHIQVEFRQDEVGSQVGVSKWAGIFGDAFERTLTSTAFPR